MKKLLLCSFVFIILGFLILIFPDVNNILHLNQAEAEEKEFINLTKSKEEKDKLNKLYRELKQQNKKLYREHQKNLVNLSSSQQASINLNKYGIMDNIIGYISIPKINIVLPIRLGANKENMSKGAVHLTETSYPIGGKNTNSVIAAHRGHVSSNMFKDIDKLEKQDKVYIQNFREKLEYEVYETDVIQPDDVNAILIQDNKDLITLISCHPYGQDTKRYVVYCKRISN